jgi:hypothetical protein
MNGGMNGITRSEIAIRIYDVIIFSLSLQRKTETAPPECLVVGDIGGSDREDGNSPFPPL